MKRTTKRIVAIGTPLATVAASGIAFAAWTATGSGTGTAQSDAVVNTSSLTGQVHLADLYPGATGSIVVKVHNAEAFPVYVTGIGAGYSADIASGAGGADCPALSVTSDAASAATGLTQVQSDGTALTPATKTIDAGKDGYYTLATHMLSTAPAGCEDQTFTLGGDSTDGTGDITVDLKVGS